MHLLATKYRNICVVGDDDQSIYEWRGADVQNILSFEQDYPDATVIKLEENYRSTKTILNLANAVIANNTTRKDKSLWTQNPEGSKVVYYEADDDRDEAYFIVRQIRDIMAKSDYHYRDFAVLIRTTAQFRSIEQVLVEAHLPYKIYGGIKFFQRREIKDILAYLYVMANPNDAVSLHLHYKHSQARHRRTDVEQDRRFSCRPSGEQPRRLSHRSSVQAFCQGEKIRRRISRLHQRRAPARCRSRDGAPRRLCDQPIWLCEPSLRRDPVAAELDMDNINEFLSIAREFDMRDMDYEARTLSGFLEEIALYTDLDQSDDGDSVSVMTMHSSKGLEFPVVFIAGFEQDLFPHIRAKNENDGLEEERRLCYVAFTRAKDQLFITSARQRLIHGRFMYNPPSEFFSELDPRYFTDVSKARHHKNVVAPTHRKEPAAAAAYAVGEKVLHSSWGEGVIVSVDPAEATKITVAFPNQGLKTLDARYAPIQKQ